ncbi:gas vesicle protein [Streptomyces sp. HUAS MG47]|uniref:gas vesicle protein n=1 Tax=Streptomyces solicamelliae TaxID=3231716 RepID=UPI003877A53F
MTARDEAELPQRQIALIDLLDRLLNGGVVLTGDLVLTIADIDLVRISLRAVIVAVQEDGRWALTPLVPGHARELEGPHDDRAL